MLRVGSCQVARGGAVAYGWGAEGGQEGGGGGGAGGGVGQGGWGALLALDGGDGRERNVRAELGLLGESGVQEGWLFVCGVGFKYTSRLATSMLQSRHKLADAPTHTHLRAGLAAVREEDEAVARQEQRPCAAEQRAVDRRLVW